MIRSMDAVGREYIPRITYCRNCGRQNQDPGGNLQRWCCGYCKCGPLKRVSMIPAQEREPVPHPHAGAWIDGAARAVAGAILGATFGGLVAGPAGAAVGTLLGALLGFGFAAR
jgi:hypothetical protein